MKLVLLTGASGGIGKELVHLLKKRDVTVMEFGRKEVDLCTKEGREKILHTISERVPDLVINNAGFGVYGEAVFASLDAQEAMIEVNVTAVVDITLHAAKCLIAAKKEGVILNVSSCAGEFATPGMAVYGATKAFVTKFSQSVDFECAPFGVRVLASLPGQVDTGFATKAAGRSVPKQRFSMSPRFAAEQILAQVEKRKQKHIFDLRYRVATLLSKVLPEKFFMKILYNQIRARL